jgi:hypothetical protein
VHERKILAAVIACPGRPGWRCGTEFEGTWLEPEDPEDEGPEEALQLCPECGCTFTAQWPGYSFRTEAGLGVASAGPFCD